MFLLKVKLNLVWDNETDNLGQFKTAYLTLFTTLNYFPYLDFS